MTAALRLPQALQPYYGGAWHPPVAGAYRPTSAPATGETIAEAAWCDAEDVDRAVVAAARAFPDWAATKPLQRAALVREAAAIVRRHGRELALIDAADCGNPVSELIKDAGIAAAYLDYFAGLATELKGDTIPMGEGVLNYTIRQPLGVVARISAFNHPFLFAAIRAGAPLVAGNTLIIKAPDQAPLSSLRLAELLGPLFPPGVFNVLCGGRACGEALVAHPGVAKVGVIGSPPTGRAVLRAAADTLKKVTLELGGKNALIAYPDADPGKVAASVVAGMNFGWCGQSCGSTSRLFVHRDIRDATIAAVHERVAAIRPGLPTLDATQMGCLVDHGARERVETCIASGIAEGATLLIGGKRPSEPELQAGSFLEPTVFVDVTPDMRIAREEIFGPVLSVLDWDDEDAMIAAVNAVDYGLTASVWTNDLATAHTVAARIEAGFVWINNSSAHFLGAPFGGWKQSGIGREESIDELFDCTQIKNINVTLRP